MRDETAKAVSSVTANGGWRHEDIGGYGLA